jgi:outer membrane usher protein
MRLHCFIGIFTVFISVLAFSVFAKDASQQKIILETIVNQLNLGEQFFSLDAKGDLYASSATLEKMRLRRQLWADRQTPNGIALKSLAPKLEFNFDENNAVLHIKVLPDFFTPQIIGDESGDSKPKATTVPLSGVFNYQFSSVFDDQKGFVGLNVPYGLAVNSDFVSFDSSFNLFYQDGLLQHNRLLSTLRYDNIDDLQTYLAGDVTPRGQRLFLGSGVIGGISLRKNFQIDRSTHVSPELELNTAVSTPTHARVLVNGRLIKEVDLLPGQVVLDSLPVSSTQGQAQLILTDANGRQTVISEPFFLMYNQLRKGLHDYEYNLGVVRNELGVKDFSYGDVAFQAVHRYGLSNSTTIGMAAFQRGKFTLINPQVQTTLGQYHQLEVDTAVSHYRARVGTAVEGRYRFQVGGFQLLVSASKNLRAYTGYDLEGAPFSHRFNASMRYGNPWLGVFNLSYNQSNPWELGFITQTMQLSYGRRVFNSFYFTTSALYALARNEVGAFIALEYRPTIAKENPNPLFDNIRYTARFVPEQNGTVFQNEVDVYRSSYLYNYNAQIVQQGENVMGNIRGYYKTDNHVYTAAYNRNEASINSGQIGVAGGIAMMPQGIFFGRPVADSFAVVQIDNPDKPTLVRVNSLPYMVTKRENVLIPEFNAYTKNQIGIQSRRFNNLQDIRYDLNEAEQPLIISKRGGAFLDLSIKRMFAIEGNIYSKVGDKKDYLALRSFKYQANGKTEESFTGEKGYFYLEHPATGEMELSIIGKQGVCTALLQIPDSTKSLLNLGDVECLQH